MPDPLELYVASPDATDANQAPSASKRLREAINDAFTFLRSCEANQAFATVTLENLIVDQIARNGDTARSNAAQYDPYSYNPAVDETASGAPVERANYLGGADTTRPTKLDRVLAVMNNIQAVVTEIQTTQPVDVASPEEYSSQLEVSAPTQDT
jgi:hypothetical protein